MKLVDTPKNKLSYRKKSQAPPATIISERTRVDARRFSKLRKTRNTSINDINNIYQNVSFNKIQMINILKKQFKVQQKSCSQLSIPKEPKAEKHRITNIKIEKKRGRNNDLLNIRKGSNILP